MAGSFRQSMIVITVLAALTCVGAIFAMWHLAETTADQRAARAEDTVTLEAERLRDLLDTLPRSERIGRGRHVGELRSGYVEDPAFADRSPVVMDAVRKAAVAHAAATVSGITEGGTPAAACAMPLARGGYVFAIQRIVTGKETRVLRVAVMLLSILSLLVVAVSLRTVVIVDRGMSILRGALAAVAKDLRAPVSRPKVRELGEIAEGLETMAKELAIAQTERERLTTELAVRERLAALGRVAAGIAHEVRNPLAAMKLRADLAKASGEATPAIARDLSDIASEIARLDRLVVDLLVVSGRRSGPHTDTDLGEVAAERVRLLQPWATERGVAIEASGSARASLDVDAIARAVDNLLRNAIEASPRGQSVIVHVQKSDGAPTLSVEDHGPGVSHEHAGELFEPFFTTKQGGTGLGLALARAVATSHGGALTYARDGEATRFVLTVAA